MKLTPIRNDRGNWRLCVKNEQGKKLVILDQGHTYPRMGLPQYELHTHTRDGEPDSPVNGDWQLEPLMVNGYKIVFNLERMRFQTSHDDIGSCEEFDELNEAIEYCEKG